MRYWTLNSCHSGYLMKKKFVVGLLASSILFACIGYYTQYSQYVSEENISFFNKFSRYFAENIGISFSSVEVSPTWSGFKIQFKDFELKDRYDVPTVKSKEVSFDLSRDQVQNKVPIAHLTFSKAEIHLEKSDNSLSNLWHAFTQGRHFPISNISNLDLPQNEVQKVFARALHEKQFTVELDNAKLLHAGQTIGTVSLHYKNDCFRTGKHQANLEGQLPLVKDLLLQFEDECAKSRQEGLQFPKTMRLSGIFRVKDAPLIDGKSFSLELSSDADKENLSLSCSSECKFDNEALSFEFERTLTPLVSDNFNIMLGESKASLRSKLEIRRDKFNTSLKSSSAISNRIFADSADFEQTVLAISDVLASILNSKPTGQSKFEMELTLDDIKIANSEIQKASFHRNKDNSRDQKQIEVKSSQGDIQFKSGTEVNREYLSVNLEKINLDSPLWTTVKNYVPFEKGTLNLSYNGQTLPLKKDSLRSGRGQLKVSQGSFTKEMSEQIGFDQFSLFLSSFDVKKGKMQFVGPRVSKTENSSLSKVEKSLNISL